MENKINFFSSCLSLINETDPQQKCVGTKKLFRHLQIDQGLDFAKHENILSIPNPGRPPQPMLVSPLKVPRRKLNNIEGHASLIHALTHIEFNAINLALDACYRFQNMPLEFYNDWLEVANDEAYHFSLLNEHLVNLGFHYGHFSAHNGLWDMAFKTENDPLNRMGLVPRVLEARGIDAVPEIEARIRAFKDIRGGEILAIIHKDEIKHVQYGDKWFKYLCNERNLDPFETYFKLIKEYEAPKIRGAFNRPDRKKAGFSDQELDILIKLAGTSNNA